LSPVLVPLAPRRAPYTDRRALQPQQCDPLLLSYPGPRSLTTGPRRSGCAGSVREAGTIAGRGSISIRRPARSCRFRRAGAPARRRESLQSTNQYTVSEKLRMIEAGIGRLLVASLHQGIADLLPTRLEFYEAWLNPAGLRDGKIGLAPLAAVLSFLRQEGEPYRLIAGRAGEYTAEWTVADLPGFRRALI